MSSAIEKYIRSKKKKLFVCFIDFKKAFDSIWHTALFLKLRQLGVSDLFYKIIKDMYVNGRLCVKTNDGLTSFFLSKVGVRQGCALSPLLFNLFLSDLSKSLDSVTQPISLFSKQITHLLYADDLVLLAESAEDLQTSLNMLNNYCKKWKLTINPTKSKVMIFSARPPKKSSLTSLNFYIGSDKIEIVESYKYLGVIFSSNGSFKMAKAHLDGQAKKALFGFHSYLSDSSLPIYTCVQLFDKLIQPIATYGAEVWAPFCLSSRNLLNLNGSLFSKYTEFPCSAVQLKFGKRILSVHEKSVNLAVLGELGHFPAMLSVLCKVINFWVHILRSPEDSLLYDAYLCSYNQFYKRNTHDKWFQLVKLLSDSYPMLKPFWEVHSAKRYRASYIDKVLWSFKKAIYADFLSFYNSEISRFVSSNPSGGRLKLFSALKENFGYEEYLSKIKNWQHRRLYTQLRISAHKLSVESGRYKDVCREDRICESCGSGDIEDEEHFLLHCSGFSSIRAVFFEEITKIHPNFNSFTSSEKVKTILNDPASCQLSAKYIYDMYQQRT